MINLLIIVPQDEVKKKITVEIRGNELKKNLI